MEKNIYTIISKDSVFKGDLILKNSLKIEGIFEGNIKTQKDVLISKTGSAKSDVRAKRVFVDGSLTGHINASASVIISSAGSVKGDIKSPNLKIEDGAITYGKVSINENNIERK